VGFMGLFLWAGFVKLDPVGGAAAPAVAATAPDSWCWRFE
jgi:hypothetical protein